VGTAKSQRRYSLLQAVVAMQESERIVNFLSFFFFFFLEGEKERGGGERERKKSQAGSMPSPEPDVGLDLTTLRS